MNIKLNMPGQTFTGQVVTFFAPCNCSAVDDGILINGELYTLYDTTGQCVTGLNMWRAGAQVNVVLDCDKKIAYIQNNGTVRVKLWQNTNVENAFNAQTIDLDLSVYDGVEIIFYADATTGVYGNSGFYPKDLEGFLFYMTNAQGHRLHRWFVAKDNGVEFENGTNTGTVSGNKVCIPYIIYGIKGVR